MKILFLIKFITTFSSEVGFQDQLSFLFDDFSRNRAYQSSETIKSSSPKWTLEILFVFKIPKYIKKNLNIF